MNETTETPSESDRYTFIGIVTSAVELALSGDRSRSGDKVGTGLYTCKDCGNAVSDKAAHDEFHKKLEELERMAAVPRYLVAYDPDKESY